MNDFDEAGILHKIVERIVMRILSNMDFVRAVPATVTSVSSLDITAYLKGDESSNTSIYKNRTGQTISIGDIVYVVMPNNNLTNAFIGWKI